MIYTFKAYGHENVLSNHKTTFEFTKDPEIGIEADCIVAVKADFDFHKLKDLIHYCRTNNKDLIRITIKADNVTEDIRCHLNMHFDDDREMVIRMSKFLSKRTFGILANKASRHLKQELKDKMKDPNQIITVTISPID
ncbi:MAG: DUF371 domain-containing protein [Nanoarchaeota archaeon]|nr:DUF371 domain-containing protein [Nanoarchaeota archaeon]